MLGVRTESWTKQNRRMSAPPFSANLHLLLQVTMKTAEAMEKESFPSLLPFPAAYDPRAGSAAQPGEVSSGQLYNRLFSVFGSNRCITLSGKEIYSFLP